MQIDFTKMQGAANDFVVLDARVRAHGLTPERIARIADRRLGVGCDQLIVLEPAAEPGDDAAIRFFNSDGSESGACGNGTRCAAALLAEGSGRTLVRLRGRAGVLEAEMLGGGQVRVDMGPARLDWRDVPLAGACDTLHLQVEGDPAACSIGNPHATLFVPGLDNLDASGQGAALERHALFPARINVGFAQVLDRERIRLVVWERGAGLTPACGSGACAAVVNAHRRGLVGRDCAVAMPGGLLHVIWREDGHVLLSGPAETIFTGSIRLDP